MYATKAGIEHTSVVHLEGRLIDLPANIRIRLKCLRRENVLA
jgi:hypothetical protein